MVATGAGIASYLPEMEAWQSGVVPYPVLLGLQGIILVIFGKACWDVTRESGWFANLSEFAKRNLRVVSGLYFAFMLLRYTIVHQWFPAHNQLAPEIPTIFHFVLAAFLFVLGQKGFEPNRVVGDDSINAHSDGLRPLVGVVHGPDVDD